MPITETTQIRSDNLPMRVRAINGAVRDDAWIRRGLMPARQRLMEAGRLAGIGLLVGGVVVFIPVIHLVGILFALTMMGVAAARLRARAIVEAAGGVCPRCGKAGSFFVGLGRRRFRLPMTASCDGCGVELTLAPGEPS